MQLTFLKGYPDFIGKRHAFVGFGKGPASYLSTGDPLPHPKYGNYFDAVNEALSVSGRFSVRAMPSFGGARAAWSLLWSYVAGLVNTVTIATPGSGQTPGTYTINATGGNGSGATAQVVVAAGGTVTAAPTLTSPGFGYTAAPTFTMPAAAGGTPATFTATLTTSGPVPAGTNLSNETVQLNGFGGQY